MTLTEVLVVVLVVLFAVLVGAALPALIQMRRTLRVAESFLERTGHRLDRVLDQAGEASGRINRLGAEIEGGLEHVRGFFDTAGELSRAVSRLRDSLRLASSIASAVGPALAAAIHAFIQTSRPPGDTRSGDPAAGDRTSPSVGSPSEPDLAPAEPVLQRETEVTTP